MRTHVSNVRVRVQEGVSLVSDADLRLAGRPNASTLSGTVTVNQITYAPQTDIGAMLALALAFALLTIALGRQLNAEDPRPAVRGGLPAWRRQVIEERCNAEPSS